MRLIRTLLFCVLLLAVGCAGSGGSASGNFHTRLISLTANDLAFSVSTGKLLCSIPSNAVASRDSILPIDPATGKLGPALAVGSNPDEMAISDDGSTLYVALTGQSYGIRKVDLTTMTAGIQFSVGTDPSFGDYLPRGLAVMPGSPQTLAVCQTVPTMVPSGWGVAVFDDGVMRANTWQELSNAVSLCFGATPDTLYGNGSDAFFRFNVDGSGVSLVDETSGLIPQEIQIRFAGGILYDQFGDIIDPGTRTQFGSFQGAWNADSFTISVPRNRAYFVVGKTVLAFSLDNASKIADWTVEDLPADVHGRSLVTWGDSGLAFLAQSPGNNHLVIIENAP